MTDMLTTIAPKSNQLNFDDLIGDRVLTIKVSKVSGVSGEQPIAINYEGDNGKPYMPCKSMRRVMVYCWGPKGQDYVGRYMTLYGDPKVKFGGLEVGGIRISHMSHIAGPITMALTSSKANKKPFTVNPLQIAEVPSVDDYISDIQTIPTLEGLQHKFTEAQKAHKNDARMSEIIAAKDKRKLELLTKPGEPRDQNRWNCSRPIEVDYY